MSRSSGSGLIFTVSVILFLWGIIYCVAPARTEGVPAGPALEILRLETISKGILLAWLGLVLFHLPALLRRGEQQAVRMLSLSAFFLAVMTFWHLLRSTRQEFLVQGTTVVLGLCLILMLVAIIQLRRRFHLPRI